MGNSISTYLVYGIDLGGNSTRPYDEDYPEWLELGEIEEELARRVLVADTPDYEDIRGVMRAAGVEVISYGYCADGDSSWMLAIPGAGYETYDGTITKVNPKALYVKSDWDARLYSVALKLELNGLGLNITPAWYLVASYG